MNTELILVVDDDDALREGLRELLEFSGYAVFTAAGGREGLQVLRQVKPDLIVTDVLMRDMDGFEFYQAVYAEEKWRDIPFLFLSAKNRFRDEARQQGIQSYSYVPKPFAVDELLGTVRRLVAS
jgi:CheY-like chemotaxis protein